MAIRKYRRGRPESADFPGGGIASPLRFSQSRPGLAWLDVTRRAAGEQITRTPGMPRPRTARVAVPPDQKPSRSIRLRSSLRARRTASAASRARRSDGFS